MRKPSYPQPGHSCHRGGEYGNVRCGFQQHVSSISGDVGKGSDAGWEAAWGWKGRGGRKKKLVFPQPSSSRPAAFNLMPAQRRGLGGGEPCQHSSFSSQRNLDACYSLGVIQGPQGLRQREAEGSGSLGSWSGEEGGTTCTGVKWGTTPSRLETTPGNRLTFTSTDGELDLGRRGQWQGEITDSKPSVLHLQVPEERPTPNIPAPAPLPSVSPSSTSCPVGLLASSLISSARATSLPPPRPSPGSL